jgi:hypothetical protein
MWCFTRMYAQQQDGIFPHLARRSGGGGVWTSRERWTLAAWAICASASATRLCRHSIFCILATHGLPLDQMVHHRAARATHQRTGCHNNSGTILLHARNCHHYYQPCPDARPAASCVCPSQSAVPGLPPTSHTLGLWFNAAEVAALLRWHLSVPFAALAMGQHGVVHLHSCLQ